MPPAHAGPTLLYDSASGHVLYAEDADQPWYPASLTKLMTAYLVFDAWKTGRVSRDSKITISAKAHGQAKMTLGLAAGKEIAFEDAIKALILRSANDIAMALAEAVSGSEDAFVVEMNATAQRLGMVDTRYINPHGLPGAGQYTTAKDLAVLTQALLRDFPEHLEVFTLTTAQVGPMQLATVNGVLVTLPGADGMKTGFTCSAGYNIVATATRNGRKLVAIVLGETSRIRRTARTTALLEYGFRIADWKLLFPAPTIGSLPQGFFDRDEVRTANLDKRFKECLDPEPVAAPLVASRDSLPDASRTPARKLGLAKQAIAGSARAKPEVRRASVAAKSRRGRKPAREAESRPPLSLAMP